MFEFGRDDPVLLRNISDKSYSVFRADIKRFFNLEKYQCNQRLQGRAARSALGHGVFGFTHRRWRFLYGNAN
jgi:hypothetical protein